MVPDVRGEVWKINDARNSRAIETELERESIESLLIVQAGEPFVIVPHGFSTTTTERICGERCHRTDLKLLSLIRPGREPERRLVPRDCLVDEARRSHMEIYGATPDGDLGVDHPLD